MSLLDLMLQRRSVRQYKNENIPAEKLEMILQAGLLAPTSRNRKPCEFYLVQNKDTLNKLATAKAAGAGMLANANAAIVVFGDSQKADTWIEDCSIALTCMNLMAVEQGIGSCWVQMHLRSSLSGNDAEANVRELFSLPEQFRVVGALALGIAETEPKPHTLGEIDWKKVHRE